MTNEEKFSKALQDFKTKYPSITSADLQTFTIGWQEAIKNCFIPDVVGRSEQLLAVAEYVYNHFDDSSSKTAKEYLEDFLSQ